jgi:hypothetical protein
MNLVTFHRVLISAGIVFCLGYGGWEFAAYGREGGTAHLVLALVFLLAAILLAVYLRRLRRFLHLRD